MSATTSTMTRTGFTTGAARWAGRAVLLALVTVVTVASAAAETLMMPKRDGRMGTSVVVWGVTTQANGTAYTIDFGDATSTSGTVGDRSYIAFNHTYATQGTFTATLTVGTEVATVNVRMFDVALLPGGSTGDANRGLGINMAIQDGLRNLWTSQASRAANFPAGVTTNWGNSFPYAAASLIVLAFENHGYSLANDGSAPTGLYEKYIVRRGLNYVMSQLSAVTLGVTPQGDSACVGGLGVVAGDCGGLRTPGDPGYSVAVAMLPFAASGALARVNTEVGGATAGMTFGQILQRLSNTEAWGMTDGVGNIRRGGVGYQLNGGQFDGSTAGWAILGFLDAAAAGATVPAWVSTEFKFGFDNTLNTNGSFDYSADANPASPSNPGPAKVGIGLQGLYFTGELTGARVDAVKANISSWWPGASPFGIGGNAWGGHTNHGGAYAMFNMFKGLKLQGITTLPDVNRSTRAWAFIGTGAEDDWHADYQDWLIANQSSPNTTFGGSFGPAMSFSCCYSGDIIESAIAELILSPVALVLPDADKFGEFGLSPATNTALELTSHTVTAKAESTGGTPVPGATVNFVILTGPNAGLTGTDTTDSNGEATFTYTDAGPVGTVGTDTIQASIGSLTSNIVEMIWKPLNSPPVAVDDSESVNEDTTLSASVATNDSDPDPDTLTFTATSTTANGTLVFAADGSYTYSPNANYCGVDGFTYTVDDGNGESDSATVTITVNCVNDKPVCTIAPSQASIWPPNHKLVSITASGATDVDNALLTYTVVSIFQDEPTNTTGDGNTAIDGYGVGTSTAQVRAERVGDPKTPGNGRVYHITFSVSDGELSCTSTVQVGVPHDQSGKVQPIDGGPIYDSTVAGPAPAVAAKGKGN